MPSLDRHHDESAQVDDDVDDDRQQQASRRHVEGGEHGAEHPDPDHPRRPLIEVREREHGDRDDRGGHDRQAEHGHGERDQEPPVHDLLADPRRERHPHCQAPLGRRSRQQRAQRALPRHGLARSRAPAQDQPRDDDDRDDIGGEADGLEEMVAARQRETDGGGIQAGRDQQDGPDQRHAGPLNRKREAVDAQQGMRIQVALSLEPLVPPTPEDRLPDDRVGGQQDRQRHPHDAELWIDVEHAASP
ncbi:MAG: hypothetical protein Q8O56_09470 [Solirubrobacteraceae bacterium]|nr:hypothetical protein [Solirubrobacteraceae bacterium]